MTNPENTASKTPDAPPAAAPEKAKGQAARTDPKFVEDQAAQRRAHTRFDNTRYRRKEER